MELESCAIVAPVRYTCEVYPSSVLDLLFFPLDNSVPAAEYVDPVGSAPFVDTLLAL